MNLDINKFKFNIIIYYVKKELIDNYLKYF